MLYKGSSFFPRKKEAKKSLRNLTLVTNPKSHNPLISARRVLIKIYDPTTSAEIKNASFVTIQIAHPPKFRVNAQKEKSAKE